MTINGNTLFSDSSDKYEKFLSRRLSRQQRRCILLMETTENFSSDGSDKNASQSIFHTVKTSGSATRHFLAPSSKFASSGEVNVVFLMEEVQKYDCIYNKYSKSYKDKYIKMNCWAKIGEKFNISAADAKKKFKNIRTGYGRYLKKLKSIPSGSGRDAVPVPKDVAGLDWLQLYISHRLTVSNMSVNPVEAEWSCQFSPQTVIDILSSSNLSELAVTP